MPWHACSLLLALALLHGVDALAVVGVAPVALTNVGLTWFSASLEPSSCDGAQAIQAGLPARLVLADQQGQEFVFTGSTMNCSTMLFRVAGEQLQPGALLMPLLHLGNSVQPLPWGRTPDVVHVHAAPYVGFDAPLAVCACDSPQLSLSVVLEGDSPLAAVVELVLHTNAGEAEVVGERRLRWPSNAPPESRTRTVAVRFRSAPASGQVTLQLRALENVVVRPGSDTTRLQLPAPTFNLSSTQVVYCNRSAGQAEQAQVQVQVEGCSPFPSVLRMVTRLLHQQGCPRAPLSCASATQINTTVSINATAIATGAARPQGGAAAPSPSSRRLLSVPLPLNLSALPEAAELHLALSLAPASNARVASGHGQLFVFGVGEGQCPAGTASMGQEAEEGEALHNSSMDGLQGWALSACCDRQAQRVRLQLDPPFSPNVSSYRLLLPTTPPLTFRQQLLFSRSQPNDVVLLAWSNCSAAASRQLLPVDGPASRTLGLDLTGQQVPCSLIALVLGMVSTPTLSTAIPATGSQAEQGLPSLGSTSTAVRGDGSLDDLGDMASLDGRSASSDSSAAAASSSSAQGLGSGAPSTPLLSRPQGVAAAVLQPATTIRDGEAVHGGGADLGSNWSSQQQTNSPVQGASSAGEAAGDAAGDSNSGTAGGGSNSTRNTGPKPGEGQQEVGGTQGRGADGASADPETILASVAAAVLNSTANASGGGAGTDSAASGAGSGGAAVRRFLKARYTLHVVPLSDPASYRLRALAFSGTVATVLPASQQQQQQQQQRDGGCAGRAPPESTFGTRLLRSQLLPLCGLPRALTATLGLQGNELQQLLGAAAAASAGPGSRAGTGPDLSLGQPPSASPNGSPQIPPSSATTASGGYVVSLIRLLPTAVRGDVDAAVALQELLGTRDVALVASEGRLRVGPRLRLGAGGQGGQSMQAQAQQQQQQQQVMQPGDTPARQGAWGANTPHGSPPCPVPAPSYPAPRPSSSPPTDLLDPGVDILVNPMYALSCDASRPSLVHTQLLSLLTASARLLAEGETQVAPAVRIRLRAPGAGAGQGEGWRHVEAGQVADVGADALKAAQRAMQPRQKKQFEACMEAAGSGGNGSGNSSGGTLQAGAKQAVQSAPALQSQQQRQGQVLGDSSTQQQANATQAGSLNVTCVQALLQQSVAVTVTSHGSDGVSNTAHSLLMFSDLSLAAPLSALSAGAVMEAWAGAEAGTGRSKASSGVPGRRQGKESVTNASADDAIEASPSSRKSDAASARDGGLGGERDAGNDQRSTQGDQIELVTGQVVSDGPEWDQSSGLRPRNHSAANSSVSASSGSSGGAGAGGNGHTGSLQASEGDWVNTLLQQQLFSSWSPAWPRTPSQDCILCPIGMFSPASDQSYCQLCPPGKYAAAPRSASCDPCPAGTFTSQWGTSQCRECIMGTYSNASGSLFCNVCPTGTTSLNGSPGCGLLLPRDPLAGVAASGGATSVLVVVFGVTIMAPEANFQQLSVETTGIAGSSATILKILLQADVASFFNISSTQVQVLAMQHLQPGVVTLNVSAVLPLLRRTQLASRAVAATATSGTAETGTSSSSGAGAGTGSAGGSATQQSGDSRSSGSGAGPGSRGQAEGKGSAAQPASSAPSGGAPSSSAQPTDPSELDGDALVNSLLDNPDPFPQTSDATGGQMTVSVQNRQVIQLESAQPQLNLSLVIWPTVSGGLLCGLLVGFLYMRKNPSCCSRWRRRSSRTQGYEWWADASLMLPSASPHSDSSGSSGSGPSSSGLEQQLRGPGDRPSASLGPAVEVQLQEVHALPGGLVAARFRIKAGSRVNLDAADFDGGYGADATPNPVYAAHGSSVR